MRTIHVLRKPCSEGTVASNVLRHGTGAINIDGCRVGFVSELDERHSKTKNQHEDFGSSPITGNVTYGDYSMLVPKNYDPPGRWPANVLLDGSDRVLGVFPVNIKGGTWNRTAGARPFNNDGDPTGYRTSGSDDSVGSASRFFQHVLSKPEGG